MIRDHYPKMAAETGDAHTDRGGSTTLLPRVFEFTELLVDKLGVTDVGASYPAHVTLHTSCHSLRSLRLGDRPARLLRAVRGLELAELPDADECCGFGGTFAVKNADVSTAMARRQGAARCSRPAPSVCTAADNSCLMQIGGVLARHGARTCAACTSPRSSRPADAAGAADDPRRRRRGCAPDFPAAAQERAREPQLRRNVRHATDVIRGKRAIVVGEMADWEELREVGARRSRRTCCATSTTISSSSRSTARAPAATCTGRATRTRPTAIVIDIIRVARRARGHQGQDDDLGRDRG